MPVYQMFVTERLEPREADRLWATMAVAPESASPERTEAAIAHAGCRIEQCVELGPEWEEWAEERAGHGMRRLPHATRVLRAPERYIAQFGQAAYDVTLGDCRWRIYRMIGKISPRIYPFSDAAQREPQRLAPRARILPRRALVCVRNRAR
jgi:hypothetical protein